MESRRGPRLPLQVLSDPPDYSEESLGLDLAVSNASLTRAV